MGQTIIVHVTDAENPDNGRITVVGDKGKAARLIETLLEDGCAEEQIKAYLGNELDIAVSHRPVVQLSADKGEPVAAEDDSAEGEEAPVARQSSAATPFVQNGVKFSSLFRPDTEFVLGTAR